MGTNPIWGEDWDDVRRLWLLDPEVAHCNHGSFGAVPASVLEAQDKIRRQMAVNPMRWFTRELPGLIVAARAEVARFLGADADDLAFVSNVSAGVSAIAHSLPLRAGDEVLSSDHAYGAVSYALDRLCARTGHAGWSRASRTTAATTRWWQPSPGTAPTAPGWSLPTR